MSFEGFQFLQKNILWTSDNTTVIYNLLCNLLLAKYIILMLLCGYLIMNTVPIPSIFIHKIQNADQCATRKLCIR